MNKKQITGKKQAEVLAARCLRLPSGVLVYTIIGSNVIISGVNGDYSMNFMKRINQKKYEDSYLFNNILRNGVSNML